MDHLDYAKNLYSQAVDDLGKDQHYYTMRLGQAAQAAALIALVEEQRKTNNLLTATLRIIEHALQYGDLTGLDDVLDSFIAYPRSPWPCGDDDG